MTFRARPMAKLNLTLDIGPRRADGYHTLRSAFLRIGLADVLGVSASGGSDDLLTATGLPCPVDGNLVLKAFETVRRRVDHRLPGLRANLDKQIPIGAGLGGGSSDAAAALDLAAAAWGIGLSPAQRAELALELGSDVPFFSADVPAALVEGRGEVVTPLPPVRGAVGVLLALSVASLSTAKVYARFDDLRPVGQRPGSTDSLAYEFGRGLSAEALVALAIELRDANDLWPAAAALMPALIERRAALEAATGMPWLMTGSGPTLFALYPTVAEATAAGTRLAADQSAVLRDVMLCATDLDNPDNTWRNEWPSKE